MSLNERNPSEVPLERDEGGQITMPEPKFEEKIEKKQEVGQVQEEKLEEGTIQEPTEKIENLEGKEPDLEFRNVSFKVGVEMMVEAKKEFPSSIQTILKKKEAGQKITTVENEALQRVLNLWWREKFGIFFDHQWFSEQKVEKLKKGKKYRYEFRDEMAKILAKLNKRYRKMEKNKKEVAARVGLKLKKSKTKLEQLSDIKKERILKLHNALVNLDQGRPVDEFRDETRRIVFYDEKLGYFVLESGLRKNLTIGDILSDYAWGISYVPDGKMVEPAYRRIAKKILTNETRRQLEYVYDEELKLNIERGLGHAQKIDESFEKQWLEHKEKVIKYGWHGVVSEAMAREVVSRLSAQEVGIPLVVDRANVLEDSKYKYDFKVRTWRARRGVGVGDEQEIERRTKKIGIQFSVVAVKNVLSESGVKSWSERRKLLKILKIEKVKEKFAEKMPVDDIVFINMPTLEFAHAYTRWLKKGKPSGGPEQFLSEELKQQLLEAVTQGLI